MRSILEKLCALLVIWK